MRMTATKVSPTINIPVITFLPSVAASSASSVASASSTAATLPDPNPVSRERALDGGVVGRPGGERNRSGRPRLAVAFLVLGLQARAQRDQIRKRGDRADVARIRDAHEPV